MMGELAGSLRERIILETRVGNRDAIAGATGKYAYAGEAWASVSPLAPGEAEQGGAYSSMPRWRVTMRKREGVDPRVRLTWRHKYLAVRSVTSDPAEPSYMTLTCDEVR
jgi:head-tail adaptor